MQRNFYNRITLAAKTGLTIVFLSLLRSVVLGINGYYIGEVAMLLSRSEECFKLDQPRPGYLLVFGLELN
jgi:hypothetical protein